MSRPDERRRYQDDLEREAERGPRPNETPTPSAPLSPRDEVRERNRAGRMYSDIRRQVHQPVPQSAYKRYPWQPPR